VVVVAALLLAAPAGASSGARYGIMDDGWLLYGPGTLSTRLTSLDRLGVHLVRFTLRWDRIAPTRPADARDPADPAYRWAPYEPVLQGLHDHGITALVTLYGAPRWANGGRPPNWLPTSGFGNFAYAAAQRFPWVRMWTAWNEPNGRTFAAPVSPRLYVQRVLNPAYASLHEASSSNLVAGGVTSPRRTPTGMSPLAFMQGMRAAHAHLDAYAQNPYPESRGETPSRTPCPGCGSFTMAVLPLVRADVTRYFGAGKQLWLTEYGYQTNPPDRLLGVSYALQAKYVGDAAARVWRQPGVTVLIQFLMRDEPNLGGWQSGLLTVGGSAKPSYRAFALPLAEVSRSGSRVVLWGQVRPGSGRRPYVLQRYAAGWRPIGGSMLTGAGGTFSRTVTLPRGARVRLFWPQAGYASPALTIP
jgi:hypothetical protein